MKFLYTFESFNFDTNTLNDIYARINKNKFRKYMQENDWKVGEEEESCLEYYLRDEFSISVDSDGLIEFDYLDSSIVKLIGSNFVKLYHFAPVIFKNDILRNGLVSGINKTNPYKNSYSGIYLTTQVSGTVINGYKNMIRATHKCDSVLVTVKLQLKDISKDNDDKDISCGKYQFVSKNIKPSNIILINDSY